MEGRSLASKTSRLVGQRKCPKKASDAIAGARVNRAMYVNLAKSITALKRWELQQPEDRGKPKAANLSSAN